MNDKYAEIVQFFRDSNNQEKLQLAANEYQKFAQVYNKVNQTLNFEYNSLSDEIFDKLKQKYVEILKNPNISQVLE